MVAKTENVSVEKCNDLIELTADEIAGINFYRFLLNAQLVAGRSVVAVVSVDSYGVLRLQEFH